MRGRKRGERGESLYVELHAKSAFSFLEAAGLPEALAERGRAARAAGDRAAGPRRRLRRAPALPRLHAGWASAPLVGAEVTLERRRPAAAAGRGPRGLPATSAASSPASRCARPRARAPPRSTIWPSTPRGWSASPAATRARSRAGWRPRGATEARALHRAAGLGIFGRFNVYVELQRHLRREQEARNEWLRAQAARLRLPLLATNAPRLIARQDRPLLDVLTCIREHTTLERAGRLLAKNSERYLKSGRVMERLFPDCPEAVANTGRAGAPARLHAQEPGLPVPRLPAAAGRDAHRPPPRALRARRARRATARGRWRPRRAGRSSASWTSSAASTWRATSSSSGTWSSTAAGATSWCRDAARPPTAPCATRWGSPRWIRWAWSCSSSASSPRSAGSGPTSISTCPAATGASR